VRQQETARTVTNTNMHVTEAQASSLLKCVRATMAVRDALTLGAESAIDLGLVMLPSRAQLEGNAKMLCAALDRIRDLEQRNKR
jgi:hypothetical protein